MEKSRKNYGITLIALVITIIVLLILAGVTIAALSGDNGILTNASKSKIETEKSNEEESRRLATLEAATNIDGATHKDSSTGTEKTVKIPAGFAVSKIEGENTIEDGLVIIDKNGNEFVWVPVENENNFRRISGYYNGNIQNVSYYKEPFTKGYEGEVEEYEKMYASVIANKGFYIGRYESGKINNKVVVQKNVPAYTNVPWGDSMTATNPNSAVELAKKFANEQKYKDVTSTLIYGIQWDATLQFFDSNYIEEDGTLYNSNSYIANSIGFGWYSDNYSIGNPNHLTGIGIGNDIKNCIKNIYDMAGNVREWTMETHSINTKRVFRGGRYSSTGNNTPISCRDGAEPNDKNDGTGFRIALYIN